MDTRVTQSIDYQQEYFSFILYKILRSDKIRYINHVTGITMSQNMPFSDKAFNNSLLQDPFLVLLPAFHRP